MNKKVIIAGAVAVALTGVSLAAIGTAHARGGPGGHAISFSELDANSDGMLTKEEMQSHRSERFTAADADGDGLLSSDELAAQAAARVADRVEQVIERNDDDGDGMLSAQEMSPPANFGDRMFSRLDTNEDGSISEEEFNSRQARRGRGHGRMGGHGHQDGSHWQ